MLTTGIDNFVGTAGNDTFNATETAAGGRVLGGLDVIDGGDGVDTLNRPLKKSPADAGVGQYDLKRSANNPDEDDERQPRLPGGDVQLHQP